ncbi:uncharacterized protein J3D65DRAFT_329481 [Phyllosticta citribraziliensis]|uniref:Transmembrane protein n=1 Tax=Phyllosticta citribraziliensis TaxID=989973 RepID=A0ABR1LTI9_9PEZI
MHSTRQGRKSSYPKDLTLPPRQVEIQVATTTLNNRRRPPRSHRSRPARSSLRRARDSNAPSCFCVTLTGPFVRFFLPVSVSGPFRSFFAVGIVVSCRRRLSCFVSGRSDQFDAEYERARAKEDELSSPSMALWALLLHLCVLAAMRRRCRERRHGQKDKSEERFRS